MATILIPSCITSLRTPAMLPATKPRNHLPMSSKNTNGIIKISTTRAQYSSKDAANKEETIDDQLPNPAGFHPSIWDHHDFSLSSFHLNFITYAEERIKELNKEVKRMLSLASTNNNDPLKELYLIEKLQRLGIAHHLEAEIDKSLQRIHDAATYFSDLQLDDCTHLNAVAVRFRLLRQAGYYVSTDVFNKFKDGKQGEFKLNLTSSVQCLLSLYQASYLGFNEEDTMMDQTLGFTRKHLESMLPELITCSPQLASEVEHALEIPLRKSGGRIEAKHYISTFQLNNDDDKLLLEFAKLDFNSIQLIQRRELDEIKRWWEDMNLKSKVPFIFRDRIVESYAVYTTTSFEPKYAFGRSLMVKINMLVTVLDDAFDAYGNLEELAPLVQAFQRWDFEVLNNSPQYTKTILQEFIDFVNEVDQGMIRTGQFNGIHYLKQAIQDYLKGLMDEAKLLYSGNMPTMEEWLQVSQVTLGLNIFFVIGAMSLGEVATKQVYDWISSKPKIIRSSYLAVRLFDDIGTYKTEHRRGLTVSNISCCMKDFGISESNAIKHLQKIISSAWKDINQECMSPNPVPMTLLRSVMSYPQLMELFYKVGHDGYSDTKCQTKDIVTFLFIDPIPM